MPERHLGHHLGDLLQCAGAAGKRNKRIPQRDHLRFALCHILCHDQLRQPLVLQLSLHKKLRFHAGHFAPGVQGAFGDLSHQAAAGAAVHQRVPALSDPSSQLLHRLLQGRIIALVCAQIYRDVHWILPQFRFCLILSRFSPAEKRAGRFSLQMPPDCAMLRGKRGIFLMKTALTIAGSDSSGGAGIQADIKTMTANGVFALSAITALTAQNTTGVTGIFETTPEFLAQQLDAVFTDIYPDAVKIGMVSSSALIETIAKKLRQYDAKHIVVDPVMVATSGSKLLQDSAIQILTGQLLPMAEVVTPNIPEAEILSGMTITDAAGMEAAAKCISEKYGCAVLCKGGHKVNDADDLLWRNGSGKWFHGERIANPNTHGTGCTLSSAIASNLAKGYPLDAAVERAKAYISGCLSAMLDLGKGSGPMDHMFALRGEFVEH